MLPHGHVDSNKISKLTLNYQKTMINILKSITFKNKVDIHEIHFWCHWDVMMPLVIVHQYAFHAWFGMGKDLNET